MPKPGEAVALAEHPSFRLGDCRVDPPALQVERDGIRHRLEAKAMQVLLALAREPGRVLSRQALEQEVWPGRVVTDDAVTTAVMKVRRALGDNPRAPALIETIAKSGYRLKVEPVAVTEPAPKFGAGPSRRAWLLLGVLSVAVLALGSWWWSGTGNGASGVAKEPASVAVLPFEDLGGDQARGYFAAGITLDLITDLSRLPGLLVIAPGSVFGYAESPADDRAIAAELGVRYLVRGGVQRADGRLRINVRLLEASNGRLLWAQRFDGEVGGVFRIQDEVVAGISTALRLRLGPGSRPRPGNATANSIAAYDEFLQGQDRYGRLTPEDNRTGQAHFERAIALDPGFARAHAGLALTWSRLAIDGWTTDPEQALSRAAAHAERAAELDPALPQVHFVRGQVALFRGQHAQAADAALTAIRLDPNYADAHALLAWILNYAGRPDRAWPALEEALRRNPRGSASYRQLAGEIHFAVGDYAAAATEFREALQRNPAHMRARLWLAATLIRLDDRESASWEAEELLTVNPAFSLSRLLLAFPLKDPRGQEALHTALIELGLPE